jgi:hypothetical protein
MTTLALPSASGPAQDDGEPSRFMLNLLVGRGFSQRFTDLTHSEAEETVERYLHDSGTWTIHLFPQPARILG